jgi:putative FmdB family regulatory protein
LPLYEYKCTKCGHRFEKIENVSASVTKKCPKCGARAERMLSAPAIQFKGSGWYVNDYGGKGSAASSKENSGDGAADKADGKSADAKSGEGKPAENKSAESKSTESKSSGSEKESSKKKK